MKEISGKSLLEGQKEMNRDELILSLVPLVKNIATKIHSTLPAGVELDDLVSSGIVGLIEAVDRFDENYGVKIESFASLRIRGAILDYLRRMDFLPRSARDKKKEIESAYYELEKKLGRPPAEEEVAEYLKIDVEKLRKELRILGSDYLISFTPKSSTNESGDEIILHYIEDETEESPEVRLEREELVRFLEEAIKELPKKEKLVLTLYYYDDMNLKEIGRILEVTESRVSQIRAQAIVRLRNKFKEFLSHRGRKK